MALTGNVSPASKIYVAGHAGLAGSAIVRALKGKGYTDILTIPRSELDLLDQKAVRDFLKSEKPDAVVMAAARVGGIGANVQQPADFIRDNLTIETNIIGSAHDAGVNRLLFLASSCIYPRMASQPIREDALLTGPLEPTNEPYALAKLAGISLCQSFNRQHGRSYRAAMLTNLYGPNDTFDIERAHVLPALIRRFHTAKVNNLPAVTLWGSGLAVRDFLYVDDGADACVRLLEDGGTDMLNVGSGTETSINDLALLIAEITGFTGEIKYDRTQPDGMPRKVLDISRIRATGWKPMTSLREGILKTYDWYLAHAA